MSGAQERHMQFGQKLADSDKKVRDKAVQVVTRWLSNQKDISEEDLRKLWKGLYFCMWHSDKLLIQQELANRLGELLFALPNDQGKVRYIRAFHWTILKEWHAIDKLRLDKFYSLIRSVVFHSFKLLANKAWDMDLTKQISQIFIDLPLNTTRKPEVTVSPGVAFHLADIYVPELEKACKGAKHPITSEAINELLRPFFRVMAYSENDILVKRTKEGIFDQLLAGVEAMLTNVPEPDSMLLQVDLESIAKTFFDLASSKDIVERHRKALYTYKGKVVALDKKIDQTVSDISRDEEEEEEGEAVPPEEENKGAAKKRKRESTGEAPTMPKGTKEENKAKQQEKKGEPKKKAKTEKAAEKTGEKEQEEDDSDSEELENEGDIANHVMKYITKELLIRAAKHAGPKAEIGEEHVRKAVADILGAEVERASKQMEEEEVNEDIGEQIKEGLTKEILQLAGKYAGPNKQIEEEHVRKAMAEIAARGLDDEDQDEDEDEDDDEEEVAGGEGGMMEVDMEGSEDDSDDFSFSSDDDLTPQEKRRMKKIMREAAKLAGDGEITNDHLRQAMALVSEDAEEEAQGGDDDDSLDEDMEAKLEEEIDENDDDESDDDSDEDDSEVHSEGEEELMKEIMNRAIKIAGPKKEVTEKHLKAAMEQISAEDEKAEGEQGGAKAKKGKAKAGKDDAEDEGEDEDEDEEDGSSDGLDEEDEEQLREMTEERVMEDVLQLAAEYAGGEDKITKEHVVQAVMALRDALDGEEGDDDDEDDDADDDEGLDFANFAGSSDDDEDMEDGDEGDEDDDDDEGEDGEPGPEDGDGFEEDSEELEQDLGDEEILALATKLAGGNPKNVQMEHVEKAMAQLAQEHANDFDEEDSDEDDDEDEDEDEEEEEEEVPKKQKAATKQSKPAPKEQAAAGGKKGAQQQKAVTQQKQPQKGQQQQKQQQQQAAAGGKKGAQQQKRMSLDDALKEDKGAGGKDPTESLDVKFEVAPVAEQDGGAKKKRKRNRKKKTSDSTTQPAAQQSPAQAEKATPPKPVAAQQPQQAKQGAKAAGAAGFKAPAAQAKKAAGAPAATKPLQPKGKKTPLKDIFASTEQKAPAKAESTPAAASTPTAAGHKKNAVAGKHPDTPHPQANGDQGRKPKRVLGQVRFSLDASVVREFNQTEILGAGPVNSPDKKPEKGILKVTGSPATSAKPAPAKGPAAGTSPQDGGAKKKRKRNRKKNTAGAV